jgi:hypothetical protein
VHEKGRNQQRLLHHLAEHGVSPSVRGGWLPPVTTESTQAGVLP